MEIKILFTVMSMLFLQACYPIIKTIQPELEIKVIDENGQIIQDAKVTLHTEIKPAKVDLKDNVKFTNAEGMVNFELLSKIKVENILIHGVQHYDWTLCISKNGYQTQESIQINKNENSESKIFILKQGRYSNRLFADSC